LDERAIVVKLGGSIISDKKVDFSYRDGVVRSLAAVIASSGERVVVVHGGGSFGHPVAGRFGLSSRAARSSTRGVSETRRAMFELNARVCDSLLAGGLRPYTFSPFPLLSTAGKRGVAWLNGLLDAGMTPVTFGDVVQGRSGFTIISGDTISRELSNSLRAGMCVFVMNVEGILDAKGELLTTVDDADARRLARRSSSDATGGVGLKVKEALRIAASGTDVAFVSGFKPGEVAKALKRLSFHGTIVRVPSRD
jgi:isopentenyl phosphate kinase